VDVLLLSTFDREGGAGRAAYRLHQGLQNLGKPLDGQQEGQQEGQLAVRSRMLVQQQASADLEVISPQTRLAQGLATAKLSLDALPLKRYGQRQRHVTFSPQWVPDRIVPQVRRLDPDVINLHWVNDGFMQIETLARLNKPLVWTLHDMWAFTGGCHYSSQCQRYQTACGACPQLNSGKERDLSRQIWRRKQKAWKSANLTVVALCNWMAEAARASSLFQQARIERIPNGLDPTVFRPLDRQMARQLLGLPLDKQLILFGSLKATSDRRKGFHLLQPALQALSHQAGHPAGHTGHTGHTDAIWRDQVELVVFGASEPAQPPDFGLKTHYLGSFRDDLPLALIYAAVDLFVLPSTEENLANTVMEAMACGIPCVAFEIGGMPDLIEHQQTGYLAKPNDVADLAQGMIWVLSDRLRHQTLSEQSRQKVMQEFTLDVQARRYAHLFAELLF
jgi:glycosyltransferase involved in cell wall biosynthesis